MASVKNISQSEFDLEVLQSDLPVLVDFYASWCPPCKALAPILDKVAEAFAGKVKICKINTDENQSLARKFQIRGIPTLIFFKKGQVVEEISGLPHPQVLIEKLESLSKASTQKI